MPSHPDRVRRHYTGAIHGDIPITVTDSDKYGYGFHDTNGFHEYVVDTRTGTVLQERHSRGLMPVDPLALPSDHHAGEQ